MSAFFVCFSIVDEKKKEEEKENIQNKKEKRTSLGERVSVGASDAVGGSRDDGPFACVVRKGFLK